MNLMYVPLFAAPRAWQGAEQYTATWHWTEFGPQLVGLVALPAFGLVLVALHRAAPPDRAAFSLAAVAFGFAFVVIVWVGYAVQVAWLWPNLRAGLDAGVELLAFRNPRSLGWAVNHAGWTLSGAAALALAGTFRGAGLERRLRILFVPYGIANLLLLPSYGLRIEWLSAPAAVSWLVVLPVASAHLAVWFRRLDDQAGSAASRFPPVPEGAAAACSGKPRAEGPAPGRTIAPSHGHPARAP